MASNHQLTRLIAGRTIERTASDGTLLTISFDDGSRMTVQTEGGDTLADSLTSPSTVSAVRQAGTALNLDLEGGGTLAITTAEETSSVMVRDKNHVLEYAD